MYHIEQVLVPVDFSSFSRSALAFARRLGAGSDREGGMARVQLGHAVEAMPPYVRSVLFPYAPLGEDDRQFEAEICAAVHAEMGKYFEFDDELRDRFVDDPLVAFGSSKEWIRRWASEIDVELIAVGSHGKEGPVAGGPGSTARRVAATAAQPVVLVRDYEPRPNVERILAAVDLGAGCRQVIDAAVGLAVDLDADLELVHVIPSPVIDDTRWMVQRHIDKTPDELEAAMRPSVKALFDETVEGLDYPLSVRKEVGEKLNARSIRWGRPAQQIGQAAHEGDIDLVVVGRGGDSDTAGGGLGRVASAVAATVPKHLMVVPKMREDTPLKRLGR